uniref:Uncharacterized protein n=1 Tax=Arundo donax TaxID=35708 RepID=A0A0A9HTC8_ARUDO
MVHAPFFGLIGGCMDNALRILPHVFMLQFQREGQGGVRSRRLSPIIHGFRTFKEPSQWAPLWIFSTCGSSSLILNFSPRWRMLIFGGSLLVDSTRPSPPMRAFSWALYSSGLGRGFGRLGHRLSVASFFGWWHIKGVGLQIGLRNEDCLILSGALYVIRKMKPSTTS